MDERPADEWVMISALQHFVFCPRQFAVIHVEKYWKDNFFTADGERLHARVDLPGSHRTSGRRVEYAMPISSARYGIAGTADAVELLSGGAVVPVEYKRGHEKLTDCDAVQLCAQAFCLEEMMQVEIPVGGLFYFETRERCEVVLDAALRERTADIIRRCSDILSGAVPAPPPLYSAKCRACSLAEYCMPPRSKHSALEYLRKEVVS